MPTIFGICEKCRQRVPATHEVREGKVYLVKDCPQCGRTESLVSNNAATWERKRRLWRYDPDALFECRLNCHECGHQHHPRMVFLDVTNRCNMNCPICINNTPAMGFVFNPPMEYFEKVVAGLARMEPKPTVQLFGGEPTVRDDLFEIIALCRRHGLRVRIVTNGLRLADEEYCRRICEAKIPVLFGFDGRDRSIYERLRKNPGAYDKKVKALENLARMATRKHTIMVCVARKINDRHMGDLIEFCHENRHWIDALHLIPLTETWEEGEFETDISTTIEDVEEIIAEAFPGERVEFVPAGIGHRLEPLARFFGSPRLTFGGVHPNCESMTAFLSDGERYRPVSHFLKRPLEECVAELLDLVEELRPRLERLDPARWLDRWRGRLLVARKLLGPLRRSLDTRQIVGDNRFVAILKILFGLARGKKAKDLFRSHTRVRAALRMIVLPFEEYHSIDSARLQNCTAGFAFEDPDTGEAKVVPVCAFSLYKNDIQRKLAEKYGGRTASPTRE